MAVPAAINTTEDAHGANSINVQGRCDTTNGTITAAGFQYYATATESAWAHSTGDVGHTNVFGTELSPASGSYAITGLLPHTAYSIRATFSNASGQGVDASPLSVTTAYGTPACTTDTVTLQVGSITMYGTITDLGGGTCTSKTFRYSSHADLSSPTDIQLGSGGSVGQQFSTTLIASPGTVVYFAFIIGNEAGFGVGATLGPFTIPADLPPTVTTQAVTSIGLDTAVGNGNVTDAGNLTITERGVVWSTSSNPTTADSKSSVSGSTGAFTAPITGLASNTLYHVRAYAINADGTSYGDDVTFTTLNSTIRQTVSADITSGSGTTSWPAATLAGSLIVVFLVNTTSDHTGTVTDSAGNTYTKADSITLGVGTRELWYTANAAAATTITVNGTPDNTFERAFIAREYTGIRASSPLDRTAHASGSSTSISSGATATTNADKELIVGATAWAATGGGGSIAAGSGFGAFVSQTTTGVALLAMEDNSATVEGTQTATFTGGGSPAYFSQCFVATFIYLDVKIVFPDVASGSGSAYDAKATVAPNAGAATGTGTAYGATEAIVIGGTGAAAGTGQAFNASARISIGAGNAAGAGIAFNANTRIISGTATTATGTGTAYGATTSPAAPAGAAAGTGSATNAVPQVVTSASVAAGTGTAFNAFAILPDTVFAIATTAAGTGSALEPAVQLIVYAIGAEGTGLAYDLPVHFPPFVGNARTTTNPLRRRMTVTVTRPRTATVHT